jgi:hypothetical protein
MDPFHVVRLAGDALDRTRQRVQQDTLGHRGSALGFRNLANYTARSLLEEGRLVKSHRAYVSFREIPRQFSLTIARWLTTYST